LPDVSLGLVLVIASASVFGPLSGWLAGQRMRNIALWGIFGIVLGPVAPALLMSAPPGRCAACRWPVAGWGGRCVACGADVRTGAPMATDPVAAAGSGTPTGAAMAPAARELPGPSIGHPAVAPVVTLAERTGTSNGDWAPSVLATELGRHPVEAPPVSPIEPAGGEPAGGEPAAADAAADASGDPVAILGSGVYVGGNRRLQAGNRYLLARIADELQLLGPVHLDPTTIADRIPIAAIEAFVLDEQLIIESRDPATEISMSFVAVSLQRGLDIQAALGAPRSAAPAE
jgi:hypothetical protein